MKKNILLKFATFIICFGCAETTDQTGNQPITVADCRTYGLACNAGFMCSLNSLGSYECLPSQGSGQNSNSGSVSDRESSSFNESSNSSNETSTSSSESNFTCCSGGQPYSCPDREEKDKCFRGEPNICTYDSSVNCGGSSGSNSGSNPDNNNGGTNSCLGVAESCQTFGDCCSDALCVSGVCLPLCNSAAECYSGCCAEAEGGGRTYYACQDASICGSTDQNPPQQTPDCFSVVWCAAETCDANGNATPECYEGCLSGSTEENQRAYDTLVCVLAAKELTSDCDLSVLLSSQTPNCLLNECLTEWDACID